MKNPVVEKIEKTHWIGVSLCIGHPQNHGENARHPLCYGGCLGKFPFSSVEPGPLDCFIVVGMGELFKRHVVCLKVCCEMNH